MGTAVADDGVVRRYGRVGRWFHAGVYVTGLLLLGTGWWLVLVGYERTSPLGRLTGLGDHEIHELAGYAMALVILVWVPFGVRGVRAFVRETARYERGDGRWLLGWPRAVFTGRFGPHSGHFDPGQRLANVVIVGLVAVLLVTGFGTVLGPSAGLRAAMFDAHSWSSYAVTPVILGHIVVAAGILPGYRGVWRSMHLGGRLPVRVARRIWPAWVDQSLRDTRQDPRDHEVDVSESRRS